MLTAKIRIETPSASQRARLALSPPTSATTAPPMMGSQIRRLSKGQVEVILIIFLGLAHDVPEPAEQRDEAKNHGKRISIQISGLHPAHRRGDAGDTSRGAVDQHVV